MPIWLKFLSYILLIVIDLIYMFNQNKKNKKCTDTSILEVIFMIAFITSDINGGIYTKSQLVILINGYGIIFYIYWFINMTIIEINKKKLS